MKRQKRGRAGEEAEERGIRKQGKKLSEEWKIWGRRVEERKN